MPAAAEAVAREISEESREERESENGDLLEFELYHFDFLPG